MRPTLLLLALLFTGCITGETYTDYTPLDDVVFELGEEQAIAQLRELLDGRHHSKPDIDPGSVDITSDYFYLSASRGPIPSVKHKIDWREPLRIRVIAYKDPGNPRENWLHAVRLEDAVGKELITILFLKQPYAHRFADLCASFGRAAKGGR